MKNVQGYSLSRVHHILKQALVFGKRSKRRRYQK